MVGVKGDEPAVYTEALRAFLLAELEARGNRHAAD
jgi:hypothetical protein